MGRRAIKITVGNLSISCYVVVSTYVEPVDPCRLCVQLMVTEDDPKFETHGPLFANISTNMPQMPNPGPRHFYFKTWSENQGLLEGMVATGAVRVVDPAGIPINSWGSKAYHVELCWPDHDMEMKIPSDQDLARAKEDWQRFFGNTCIQHLGM